MTLQLQIEKLKGFDNYIAWAVRVRAYLESEDLWTVVDCGAGSSKKDQLKDKRAKFIILCLMETKLCEFEDSSRTASDLWAHLHAQHSF